MSDANGHDDHGHFAVDKVFGLLFLFTALEVAWGYAGHGFGWGKVLLWGGLIGFALLKGYLIAVYFMHLKFEGWIVKGLILPTPFLIAVIFGYVVPDVANKEGNLVYPVGSMLNTESGEVLEDLADEKWGTTHADIHRSEGGDH